MKTILVTAYDVDPYRGSESGMGWNLINQILKYNKVLAITRKNNRKNIEKYIATCDIDTSNIIFYYYDLPIWMRFWKKGQRGSSIYFYLWQIFIPVFIKKNKLYFDLAHNLNFHTDWVPSWLWVFRKPFIWGPIGHHPKIPRELILPIYGYLAFIKDRAVWLIKKFFWNFDIFLWICKHKATAILCMNSSVAEVLRLRSQKNIIFPSVGSEKPLKNLRKNHQEEFTVLSVGRFVPLKGFDIVIESFAVFWQALDEQERLKVNLELVGKGPQETKLRQICKQSGIEAEVKFINWIDREALTAIYIRSSVFLFGSHEGAGMVVSEALSYGLPVLCFDNYGPGEFIDNTCGIKIDYSSYKKCVQSFAESLLDLYRNPQKRERLSQGAKKRFDLYFDWNKKGEKLREIYESIL